MVSEKTNNLERASGREKTSSEERARMNEKFIFSERANGKIKGSPPIDLKETNKRRPGMWIKKSQLIEQLDKAMAQGYKLGFRAGEIESINRF